MTPQDEPTLKMLDWDSECFGIRVAEMCVRKSRLDQARRVLEAEALAYDLIYLRGELPEAFAQEIARAFNGQRTDTRANFEMSPIVVKDSPAPRLEGHLEVASARSLRGDAERWSQLVALAIESSAQSRFRNDDRFPDAWVDKLYTIWLERSIAGERADEVLVLLQDGRPIGLHTIRVDDDMGRLDLFAVDPERRGAGVGSRLLTAGLTWMRGHGLARASVTTQLDNPVCRLYREFGYSLGSTEDVLHLWPSSRPFSEPGSEPQTPGSPHAP